MNNNPDKRDFERHGCNAMIEFSYFNQTSRYDARVMNCGAGGICFQSSLYLQPGSTVYIRVKEFQNFGSHEGGCDGLRCISLAQVKWCNEMPSAESAAYDVGVKYQSPSY